MNITLIGMSGAGKSHIGKMLAERLGIKLLDIDRDVWEIRYGKPIQEILDERGEDWYVAEEGRLIIESTKGKDGLVISPPGSVVYQPEALKHLKAISTVIYLKVPFETIEERNKNSTPHAVIGLGRKSLRELYDERAKLYEEHAHCVLETEKYNEQQIIDSIVGLLNMKMHG